MSRLTKIQSNTVISPQAFRVPQNVLWPLDTWSSRTIKMTEHLLDIGFKRGTWKFWDNLSRKTEEMNSLLSYDKIF